MNANAPEFPYGYFAASRHPDSDELLEHYPQALWLAYLIAKRARYREGISPSGNMTGEAFIGVGDFLKIGFTARNYRTAINTLRRLGFAAFKTTNKGTIATLIDTRLFWHSAANATSKTVVERQKTAEQPATNKEGKEGNKRKGISPTERVSFEKELEEVDASLRRIRNSYEDHMSFNEWSKKDRDEYNRLKKLQKEIKSSLGRRI